MFITFEGIEGCGKTTQIKYLEKELNHLRIPILTTLEPGGTRIGNRIRQILLDSRNKSLTPLAELLLYAADRAQHINEVICPALDQNKWVICDRYFDATIAYQGFARGQDIQLINLLNDMVTNGMIPDITFLLDCSVEVGLHRALKRISEKNQESQDRFEREKFDFHHRVREGYLELACKDKKRFHLIDASQSQEVMAKDILKALRPFIEKHR